MVMVRNQNIMIYHFSGRKMLTTCSVTNKLHLIADYGIFCDGESKIFYNSIVEIKLEHEYDISCINSMVRRGQHTNAGSWCLHCLTSTDCNNASQRETRETQQRLNTAPPPPLVQECRTTAQYFTTDTNSEIVGP